LLVERRLGLYDSTGVHDAKSERLDGTGMIAIRIPRQQWGKAWRAMIEIAPVRVVSKEPICEVYPAHLEMLEARGFAYEVIDTRESNKRKARRAAPD
jgi:hypothetical protein